MIFFQCTPYFFQCTPNLPSKIQILKFSCTPNSLTQNEPKLNVAIVLGGGSYLQFSGRVSCASVCCRSDPHRVFFDEMVKISEDYAKSTGFPKDFVKILEKK